MFWHTRLRRPGGPIRAALFALLFSATVALGGASSAQAGTDSFCSNTKVYADTTCPGPIHSLTAVRGTNNGTGAGCGGVVNYGRFYCATPAGCHTYNGSSLWEPSIRHRQSSYRYMSGYSTWGSTGPPTNCDPGTPYRVSGPLAMAASDPAGVPVLEERNDSTAPDDVAALLPGADPDEARAFTTPLGDGWVLVDPTTRRVCVVVDDAGTGFGQSCQGYNQARLRGSLTTLEDDDETTADGDVVIAVVPEDSEGLTVERRDGTTRELAPVDGVVVAELGTKDTAVALDASADADVTAQRLTMGARR